MKNYLLILLMTLTLSSELFAQDQNPLDLSAYSSDRFSYVLRCNDELISAVRYQWLKRGLKVRTNFGSIGEFSDWAEARFKQSGFEYPSFLAMTSPFHYAAIRVNEQMYMEWRKGIRILPQGLDLPVQIESCKVEPLWAMPDLSRGSDYNMPTTYASKHARKLGRVELMQELQPIDLVLSFLYDRFREDHLLLGIILSEPSLERQKAAADFWEPRIPKGYSAEKGLVNNIYIKDCRMDSGLNGSIFSCREVTVLRGYRADHYGRTYFNYAGQML